MMPRFNPRNRSVDLGALRLSYVRRHCLLIRFHFIFYFLQFSKDVFTLYYIKPFFKPSHWRWEGGFGKLVELLKPWNLRCCFRLELMQSFKLALIWFELQVSYKMVRQECMLARPKSIPTSLRSVTVARERGA